jgi:capsular polysaccharide transport system permease protein
MSNSVASVLSRHLNVLSALIIRDLMGRYGRNHLGFVWTILEPMILCVGVMSIWSLIHEPIIHGMPIVAFVLTGYMPLTLWRHLVGPLIKLLRNNAHMLYHRPVSHTDIMLARCLLEFFSTTAAVTVIYFVLLSTGLVEPIKDPSLALAGWLFTGWYFGAQGVLISAWAEWWEPAEKFIQPSNYLQLPISGVFLMVDWLPLYAQKLLLLNPSVHCFEMVRAGFFGEAIPTHYNTAYLTTWCVALTVLAFVALNHVRDRLETN